MTLVLIGVAEAARRSGLSQERIRQLLRAGRLEGRKIAGNAWGVEEGSLEAYLKTNRRPGPKPS